MSSVPFIEIKDVAFAYGDRPILNNINFSIPQGNFAAVMGGSGSGKTTLMRLITGQIHPQSGRVLIEGRDLAGFSADELYEHRRRMGVLFQHGALFTDLSVFDNIAFPMRELTRLPEAVIRDLVLLKLNAVGLRGVENLMPSELSGGMSRRVALARTIALDPEIMLYDEPFTGLDPISLGVIAHLISRVNKALRSTSIMVTHDIEKSLENRRSSDFLGTRRNYVLRLAAGNARTGFTLGTPVCRRLGRRPRRIPLSRANVVAARFAWVVFRRPRFADVV